MRVNDVEGVGGFVLPGDRVDVMLTRQIDKNAASTDVVLQNARVLAIDQIADDRTDKPAVVKAVTLEVDTVGAQKISLVGVDRHPLADLAQSRRGGGREHAARYDLRSDHDHSALAADRKGSGDVTTVEVDQQASRASITACRPRV